jgi:hypothetical protein
MDLARAAKQLGFIARMRECSLKPAGERNGMMRYVGIDVGKAKCRAALMNHQGNIEKEFFFENNNKGIANLVSTLTVEDRVVMESTGNLWLNIYDALDSRKIKVVLANPMKMKAIASARVKTDKVDARILAHLLRADLVAESYVPAESEVMVATANKMLKIIWTMLTRKETYNNAKGKRYEKKLKRIKT